MGRWRLPPCARELSPRCEDCAREEKPVRMASRGQHSGPSPLAGPRFNVDIRFMTTEEHLAQLQAQIDELHAKQAELHKEFAKAQIDQWQGRIEDLELQMHLGATEANDKLATVMDQLRSKWADARRQFEDATSTASSVADTVRTGLENAVADVRKAMLESKDKIADR